MTEKREYYDWKTELKLDDANGVPFNDWLEDFNHPAPFAWHPEGFRIFLKPADIEKFDEYKDGDPYEVAQKLDSTFQEQRKQVTLRLLSEAVEPHNRSPRILDVGCGEGHITYAMLQQHPDALICAFDGALTAVRRANELYPDLEFEVADAYRPPYPPQFFDCIVCNNIWEHVPDPLALLGQLERLLKPGGHLIASTPSRYRLNNLLRVAAGKPIAFASRHHVTEYTIGQVIEQMDWGGFRVIEIASENIVADYSSVRTFVKSALVAPIVQVAIGLVRSHHKLGHTAFYLAAKKEASSANDERSGRL